jgi:NAD(P)-dependent dehydrogenase (short-subunit alcohol dehydrogenase family)
MDTGLAGKGVLVTGASGGIGSACARAFAEAATPEDVARQMVVLASDEMSGHVTGQAVLVPGGMEGRLLHAS